jgi:UDP-N-acetylmuramate--alanine ligase
MGIAGAGMNALAELLVRQRISVTGCDLNPAGCENLRELGVLILEGHDPSHLDGCRALVISSAVPRTHPEVMRAAALGIETVRRAEALAELVQPRGSRLVAVAGTHGKTTTTVMTTFALAAAGLDPTGVVGGRVAEWGGNLRPGAHGVFVVEADEYDRSFLALTPEIAVVTNVEADHLDIYKDVQEIRDTFALFVSRARSIVLCGDDPGARSLASPPSSRPVFYGVEPAPADTDIVARNVRFTGTGSRFEVHRGDGERVGELELSVPGVHNIRNALAAAAVGLELGVTLPQMAGGLRKFRGVQRRFEILGTAHGVTVVDDYAHHPTEIVATMEAARRVFPGRRIVCAFQPHLYSRTRDFAAAFGAALALADLVLLTEIYPARERPIEGVDAGLVQRALASAGGKLHWRGARKDVVAALRESVRDGDVILTLGAGDITAAGREFFQWMRGN